MLSLRLTGWAFQLITRKKFYRREPAKRHGGQAQRKPQSQLILREKRQILATDFADYADWVDFVFASRCGLGSGFLDTSICEACCQHPLGHQG
jgi:hypothetical protein